MQTPQATPRFAGLYRGLALSALLPLAAVLVLQHRFGMPLVEALAIAAIFPLADIVGTWLVKKRLEPLGALMLGVIVAGVVASLVSGDVHFALVKESFGTLAVSAAFFGSLLARRPLIFWLGRQFSTGGDPQRQAAWDERWQEEGFRRAMRLVTAVWGAGYLLDAVARAVAAYTLPPNVVVVLSPLSVIAISAVLVFWTVRYSRSRQNQQVSST